MSIPSLAIANLCARLRRPLTINAINVGVLILGFAQQILVVRLHGAGAETDLYFLVVVLPQVLVNLAGNIINNSLLPGLVAVKARHGEDALAAQTHFFLRGAMVWAGGLGLFGLLAVAGQILRSGHAASPSAWAITILASLTIPLSFFSAFFATRLNAEHRHWIAMAGLSLPPLCGILAGLMPLGWGVVGFAAGQLVGAGLQAAMLARALGQGGIRGTPPAHYTAHFPELPRKMGLLAVLGVSYQFLPVIERSYANHAGEGAVTLVALGSRLGGMLSPVLAAGASMLLFTEMSEASARGQVAEAARRLFRTLAAFQGALAFALITGPWVLGHLLHLLVADENVMRALMPLLPDYLMAGALGATGLIVGKGCYVLLRRQDFQVIVGYLALAVYLMFLVANAGEMSVRVLALAVVIFNLAGIVPAAIFLNWRTGWVGLGMNLGGLAVLVAAWSLSRLLYG